MTVEAALQAVTVAPARAISRYLLLELCLRAWCLVLCLLPATNSPASLASLPCPGTRQLAPSPRAGWPTSPSWASRTAGRTTRSRSRTVAPGRQPRTAWARAGSCSSAWSPWGSGGRGPGSRLKQCSQYTHSCHCQFHQKGLFPDFFMLYVQW